MNNKVKEFFNIADKEYKFDVEKKKPFLQGPLLIPKKEGDYFTAGKEIF